MNPLPVKYKDRSKAKSEITRPDVPGRIPQVGKPQTEPTDVSVALVDRCCHHRGI
ncbi:MAG: hypothetical protein ACI8T1_001180 [Verrucomicrobiales bacterium]|jgi:hypothetical protein